MTSYPFKQLINGEWVDANHGGTWDLVNPATETIIQQVPFGDESDALRAIESAQKAFKLWSRKTPYERADVLLAAADWILARVDELAIITTEESGKPLSESLAEWRSATNYLKWNAEECKRAYGRSIPARVANRRIHVIQQPLGVVGVISAWNFPVYNNVRAWSAALAAGCAVVGRPSEYTPRSAMLLAQALHEGGAPSGVINCINGDPSGMGQAMLNHPDCRKISFTGSTRVGKLLMEGAARTVTRLGLEMGGNAPVIIFPDVKNIEQVARDAVAWKYRNAGQVCVSPQRFYVHSRLVEPFIEQVAQLSQQMVIGNGLHPQTTLGPLINSRQRERVETMVASAKQEGAIIVTGGGRPPHLESGYFYQPTVLTQIKPGMAIHDEEIFGPVLPIIPFEEPDEAIAMANNTEYGLAAFVLTNDINTAYRASEELEYGMICINDWLPATPEAPFGGIKQSGIGRECGLEGFEHYLETKTIFTGNVN